MKTKYLLLLCIIFSYSDNLYAIQFTRSSVEGVSITYATINSKTCRVTYIDTSASGSVTIPSRIDGYDVVSIHDAACRNCSSIESVFIPNSVTSIGWQAFSNCSSLVSIEIPSSVTSIGNSAFYNCNDLTSIIIPENITSIGESTFWGCANLISITIPESVTSIGNQAFSGCSGLTSVTIPKGVTSIGNQAFSGCSGLTSVTITKGVTTISSSAFNGCSGLTSVTIPNSVTSIGNYAFSGCSGLTSVTIPNSVTSIGNHAFFHCSGLTSVTIPNSVTSIDSYAFASCSALTSIAIPNSVISIGSYTFRDCVSLEAISLSENIVTLGDNFLNGCSSLNKLEVEQEVPTQISSSVFNGIPNDVILLVPYAASSLYKNSSWKNYFSQIQERLPKIGYVFNANIKNNDNEISAEFSVINISPLEVKVGNGQSASIEGVIFGNIIIPHMVTLNDSLDFHVKGVGEHAFDGMNITSISIENGIEYIEENSFKNCSFLSSISIPNSITAINETFNECCLNNVNISQRDPGKISITNNAFSNLALNATLYVPAGTKERYEAIEAWSRFSQIIESSPISTGDISARYGSQADLPVFLKNTETISGLQFKLTLPEGVTVVDNEGSLVASTTERTEGFTIMGRKDPDEENSYLFVVLSLNGNAISGTEGAFMNVRLDIAQNVELGVHNIKIEDVYMATNTFDTQNPAESTSELTIKDYTLGDVNGDGKINVTDVGMVIDHILEHTPNGFIASAADINGDGIINVTDVGLVIDIILSDNSAREAMREDIEDFLEPQ